MQRSPRTVVYSVEWDWNAADCVNSKAGGLLVLTPNVYGMNLISNFASCLFAGAIYSESASVVVDGNSTFSGNEAENGGECTR